MKNRIAIGAVVAALFFVCIALNAKVVKYTDFIGVWYHKSDGIQYIFEDGIIKCADNEIILLNNDIFSGAYTFAKNKAAIFMIDDNGVGEIVELHLVRKVEGDRLCERKDGNEIIWFCRNRETTIDDTIFRNNKQSCCLLSKWKSRDHSQPTGQLLNTFSHQCNTFRYGLFYDQALL